MSTNCLVTKLKGNVDNNNLPKFGIIKILVDATPVAYRSIGLIDGTTDRCYVYGGTINGNNYIDPKNNYLVLDSSATIVSDGTYGSNLVMIEVPKYKVKSLSKMDMDAQDYNYSPITSLAVNNITNANSFGEVASLSTITSIAIEGSTDTEMDVSKFGIGGNLTRMILRGTAKQLKGSFDKLGMSPLTEIVMSDNDVASMSVENFVAYNRAAGRTTGSINIKWLGAVVATFNNHRVEKKENNALSWTASTITLDEESITA